MIRGLLLILLAAAGPSAALADNGDRVRGPATVITGNTLVVQGQRLTLFGIDAPDEGQTCEWPNKRIDCGRIAATALMDLLTAVEVECRRRAANPDGSWTASCTADGFDVGRNMVYTGWAVAVPGGPAAYASAQETARQRRHGMWKGSFQMPWAWRQAQ